MTHEEAGGQGTAGSNREPTAGAERIRRRSVLYRLGAKSKEQQEHLDSRRRQGAAAPDDPAHTWRWWWW